MVATMSFQILFTVDDPLDAFAVHFGGGFFGTFATPLLMNNGVLIAGDTNSAQVCSYFGWH